MRLQFAITIVVSYMCLKDRDASLLHVDQWKLFSLDTCSRTAVSRTCTRACRNATWLPVQGKTGYRIKNISER